jgi:hypothetical protein
MNNIKSPDPILLLTKREREMIKPIEIKYNSLFIFLAILIIYVLMNEIFFK